MMISKGSVLFYKVVEKCLKKTGDSLKQLLFLLFNFEIDREWFWITSKI
jgi:hypothetical protein